MVDRGRRPFCFGWEYSGFGRYVYCTFKLDRDDIYSKYYLFTDAYPNIVVPYEKFVLISFIVGEIDDTI